MIINNYLVCGFWVKMSAIEKSLVLSHSEKNHMAKAKSRRWLMLVSQNL